MATFRTSLAPAFFNTRRSKWVPVVRRCQQQGAFALHIPAMVQAEQCTEAAKHAEKATVDVTVLRWMYIQFSSDS